MEMYAVHVLKDSSPETTNEDNNLPQDGENQDSDNDLSALDSNFESFSENNDTEQKEVKEVSGDPNVSRRNHKKLLREKYKIFTNEYDEIKNAEDLENEDEIIRLRKNLDQQLTNLQSLVSKLANKLQRQLLAKQNRSWKFDLEEGGFYVIKKTNGKLVLIDKFHNFNYFTQILFKRPK